MGVRCGAEHLVMKQVEETSGLTVLMLSLAELGRLKWCVVKPRSCISPTSFSTIQDPRVKGRKAVVLFGGSHSYHSLLLQGGIVFYTSSHTVSGLGAAVMGTA